MTEEYTPQRRGVPLWAQIIVWMLLVGLLVIVAMGLKRAQQGTVQPGQKIDNFTLTLFSGYEYEGKTQVSMEELRGKVVVINIWASWCKTCEQEAAELQAAWEKYEPTGQVVFLGVDYVDTEPEARVYLKKFGVTYPNGPDLATHISQYLRVTGAPETYFIDKNGVLRYVEIGPFITTKKTNAQRDISAQIDPLLK